MQAKKTNPLIIAALLLAAFIVFYVSLLAFVALAEPTPRKAPASDPPATLAPEPLAPEPLAPQRVVSRYPERVVAQARLTTNEAGLGSARRPTIDGPMIGWIEAHNADVNGMTLVDWIEHAHPRHAREDREDGNRWVAFLDASLARPLGWPEDRIPWDSDPRGRAAWERRLDEAADYQAGAIELTCPAAYPRTWGGPYVDRCRLLRQLIAGTHRVVAGPRISDCIVRDETGAVVETLREPPDVRRETEACYVADDGGDLLTDARNVYLARVSDLER